MTGLLAHSHLPRVVPPSPPPLAGQKRGVQLGSFDGGWGLRQIRLKYCICFLVSIHEHIEFILFCHRIT